MWPMKGLKLGPIACKGCVAWPMMNSMFDAQRITNVTCLSHSHSYARTFMHLRTNDHTHSHSTHEHASNVNMFTQGASWEQTHTYTHRPACSRTFTWPCTEPGSLRSPLRLLLPTSSVHGPCHAVRRAFLGWRDGACHLPRRAGWYHGATGWVRRS